MAENTNSKYKLSDEQISGLIKMAQIGYNLSGVGPVEASFAYTEAMMKSIILRSSKNYIGDITEVTFDVNHKNGDVNIYVWLPRTSSHLVDNSLQNSDSQYAKPIMRYSNELKEFMDKFCLKGEKRVIPDQNPKSKLVGIKINISPFLELEMDRKSIQFNKIYGAKKDEYRVKVKYEFTKPGSGSSANFGNISRITVTKSKPSYRESVAPRPKRSFHA